jgi:malonyl-CoA O-methyltransferase
MSTFSILDPHLTDQRLARQRASRAASSYRNAEAIPNEVANRLLDHLDPISIVPEQILELGAANGYLGEQLLTRYPRARQLSLDHSLPMIHMASRKWRRWFERRRAVCADATRLPVADSRVALLVSNLLLHWCGRLDVTLNEWARVTAPGGLVLFSTYGPDTLVELRGAFAAADALRSPTGHGTPMRVTPFLDMHDIGDQLSRSGFTEPVMETERLTLTYREFTGLTGDLKSLGATCAARGRVRGLLGRATYQRALDNYEVLRSGGTLPATLEVIYGHAWRGTPQPTKKAQIDVGLPIDPSRRRGD